MHDISSLVLGSLFILGGIVTFWRGAASNDATPEAGATEFVPQRWSPRSLRFAGIGMVLLGILMLVGAYLHLL